MGTTRSIKDIARWARNIIDFIYDKDNNFPDEAKEEFVIFLINIGMSLENNSLIVDGTSSLGAPSDMDIKTERQLSTGEVISYHVTSSQKDSKYHIGNHKTRSFPEIYNMQYNDDYFFDLDSLRLDKYTQTPDDDSTLLTHCRYQANRLEIQEECTKGENVPLTEEEERLVRALFPSTDFLEKAVRDNMWYSLDNYEDDNLTSYIGFSKDMYGLSFSYELIPGKDRKRSMIRLDVCGNKASIKPYLYDNDHKPVSIEEYRPTKEMIDLLREKIEILAAQGVDVSELPQVLLQKEEQK
jgi:hypothetical protein